MDVDGTLTDGGMYYGPDGEALKKFNTRDAMGVARVRELGLTTVIVTRENSPIAAARAEKMRVTEYRIGVLNKRLTMDELCTKYGLEYDEIAFIGDDVNDLPALDCVGFPAAVGDALPPVKAAACFVAKRNGGEGAVRELCELLLTAQAGEVDSDEALLAAIAW
jgi:N-acylneuraminate cytidylyltransferase